LKSFRTKTKPVALQTRIGPVQKETMHDKHTYLNSTSGKWRQKACHDTWTSAQEQH